MLNATDNAILSQEESIVTEQPLKNLVAKVKCRGRSVVAMVIRIASGFLISSYNLEILKGGGG